MNETVEEELIEEEDQCLVESLGDVVIDDDYAVFRHNILKEIVKETHRQMPYLFSKHGSVAIHKAYKNYFKK